MYKHTGQYCFAFSFYFLFFFFYSDSNHIVFSEGIEFEKWSDGFTGTTLYMQHVLGGLDYQKLYIIETFSWPHFVSFGFWTLKLTVADQTTCLYPQKQKGNVKGYFKLLHRVK